MNDFELLSLAFDAQFPNENYIRLINDAGRNYWNPLENDAQAFKLAISLDMQVEYLSFSGNARARARFPYETEWQSVYCFEDGKVDRFYAARRAIVLAAAEIGKKEK